MDSPSVSRQKLTHAHVHGIMSLTERLDKIRSQPKLQNQKETAVVLGAVEDTLRDQKSDFTPTAYFAALLSLLVQYISSSKGIVNKEVALAVVYLLDLVAPHVPAPLLRSKFTQILSSLAQTLTHPDAEAPLLRSSIGCLETLLVQQDAQAWTLPQSQISPRRAMGGLLTLAVDHRPKVRKRAQEALTKVLKHPPPSPSVDHPAADMCAEAALQSLIQIAEAVGKHKRKHKDGQHHEPGLIHALQLVKTIAAASGGWPSRKLDSLCEVLLEITKSSNEYMTTTAFEVFEVIFEGMANEFSSPKLPRLLDVILDIQPSQNDSQLLPPWIAVLSRGYDVLAQVNPEDAFSKLPDLFPRISSFLSSSSHNIRVSASECLISFLSSCIPDNVLIAPSIYEEKTLEKVSKTVTDLLSVKYQSAWMEAFQVCSAMFDALRWRSAPLMNDVVKTVGELRISDSFPGKKECEEVIAKAISATGPDNVLEILPLNMVKQTPGQPGRAWLLPLMRDAVRNTKLAHFRSELVPLSEKAFQKVLDHGSAEKVMEIKIYETIVQQVWSILPGYCDLPLDLGEAFDQSFAELLSNLLYQQPQLRHDISRALQTLVDSNQLIAAHEGVEDLVAQGRVSREDAQKNIVHLATFASNLLAVLFNVYSETLPQNRGPILRCINAYLGIITSAELQDTFSRVSTMLESSLAEEPAQTQADKQKHGSAKSGNKMPPTSHTLMDLVITMSIYLPRDSYQTLFSISSLLINRSSDPQLQKKAYKLLPRLAESPAGVSALQERSGELQRLLMTATEYVTAPARRDRLAAFATIVNNLPNSDLHFIPTILSEVVISAKEVNERARNAAFDLLVLMGNKMKAGGTVDQSKVPHMADDAPKVQATLEEYFTMVSAGLAGTTPHMISASITALTRILYEFRNTLSRETIEDLVKTMDLFLTSNNREVVRSVLGFVKVTITSLPDDIVKPRLQTLVPNLMVWSHEHKAQFKAKVKHIVERMIRRFGVELVEKLTPEADRKLISNIRKVRERSKRKRDAGPDADNVDGEHGPQRKGKFESEYDNAIYGSESDSGSGSGESGDEDLDHSRKRRAKRRETYIIEDEDEPLDLLSRKALGSISTTRPQKQRQQQQQQQSQGMKKTKAKSDVDGKLIFKDDDDDDEDLDTEMLDTTGGINAYVSAIRGRDAAQRGQRGKLKFRSAGRNARGDGVDEEDDNNNNEGGGGGGRGRARPAEAADGVDGRAIGAARKKQQQRQAQQQDRKASHKPSRGGAPRGRGRGGRLAGGGVGMPASPGGKAHAQKRSVREEKVRGGRVTKRGGRR